MNFIPPWCAIDMSCWMPVMSCDAVGCGLVEPRSLMGSSEKITQRTPGWPSTSRSKRLSALWPLPSTSSRLPLMPSFRTPMVSPAPFSREARTSVQRWLASPVDAYPSVMEAPRATTAPCEFGFWTSRPVRKYQLFWVCGPDRLPDPLWSPETMYVVCMDNEWKVEAPVEPGRYMLTVTLDEAGTLKLMVSLVAVPSAGMVTEVAPPKVTVWSVPDTMAEPEPDWAMCTSATVSDVLPKTLDSWMRAAVPLMLVCTIWRTVCWAKELPPLSGEVAHVPVHATVAPEAGADVMSWGITMPKPMAVLAQQTVSQRERPARRPGGPATLSRNDRNSSRTLMDVLLSSFIALSHSCPSGTE